MSAALHRHVICRQIFELRVPDAAQADRLHSLLASGFEQHIAPQLDRALTEASDADATHRIDRLVLDIGRLDPDDPIADLEEKLRPCLAAALDERLHAPRAVPVSPAAASLALIGHFARTGSLPWWSDARAERAVPRAVETARQQDPPGLVRLLRTLSRTRDLLDRLVLQLDDAGLEALLALLARHPAEATVPRQLLGLLAAAPALAGIGRSRLRQLLWREALKAACAAEQTASWADIGPTVLAGLALEARTDPALLVADLEALLRRGEAASEPLRALIAEAARRTTLPTPIPAVQDAPAALLDRLRRRPTVLAALLDLIRPHLGRLSATASHECAAALASLLRIDDERLAGPASLPAIRALLRPFLLPDPALPEAALDDALRDIERREVAAALAAPRKPGRTEPSFDDADARYLENAGLCLLWPFLDRYFARLTLTRENESFIDALAQHRAVGILHHVATGEREPPEHWLALNKSLCGLPLDAPHVFTHSVTDAEAEESGRLLAAAIAHAACLGPMTADGLRAAFLLRRGALATRDGAWLLRVERQPQDILLDRFPWQTEWIRLNWMPVPLRVEW